MYIRGAADHFSRATKIETNSGVLRSVFYKHALPYTRFFSISYCVYFFFLSSPRCDPSSLIKVESRELHIACSINKSRRRLGFHDERERGHVSSLSESLKAAQARISWKLISRRARLATRQPYERDEVYKE